ncbi:gag protein [Lasius niger]|uniref:Gag protein n=1 Tax=Lasius niger TaxID=67767 RepID=A0A0J7JV22_LASNI|nr:gag protein [Lasius niger]
MVEEENLIQEESTELNAMEVMGNNPFLTAMAVPAKPVPEIPSPQTQVMVEAVQKLTETISALQLKVEALEKRGGGQKHSEPREIRCFFCNRVGHIQRDCRTRRNQQRQQLDPRSVPFVPGQPPFRPPPHNPGN